MNKSKLKKYILITTLVFTSYSVFAQKDSVKPLSCTSAFLDDFDSHNEDENSKICFKTLFSISGDTVITFQGRGDKIGDFVIYRRSGNKLKFLQIIFLPSKKIHDSIVYEYPADTIKKYKLFVEGTDVDIINSSDIVIEQKDVKNERGQKSPFKDADSVNYVYNVVKKVTIKIGGKVIVKNLKIEWDYISAVKENNEISKKDLINYRYPAMDGLSCRKIKNMYYVKLTLSDKKIHYAEPRTLDIDKNEVFRKEFLIPRK